MNLDWSGQKWDVAPVFMIASALSSGVAMVALQASVKLSWGVEVEAVLVNCFV